MKNSMFWPKLKNYLLFVVVLVFISGGIAFAVEKIIVEKPDFSLEKEHDKVDLVLKDGASVVLKQPELILNSVDLAGFDTRISFNGYGYQKLTIGNLISDHSTDFVFKVDYSSGKADYLIIEATNDNNPEHSITINLQSATGIDSAENIPLILDKSKTLVFYLNGGLESLKLGDFYYYLTPQVKDGEVNWSLVKGDFK